MLTHRNTAYILSFAVTLLSILGGCESQPTEESPTNEGSQAAAEAYFKQDMAKWMAGQESEAKESHSRLSRNVPPISYDVVSVFPAEPDWSAGTLDKGLPKDYQSFPAYQFNAVLLWRSEAGRPMETVNSFTLTWNIREKKWFFTRVYG